MRSAIHGELFPCPLKFQTELLLKFSSLNSFCIQKSTLSKTNTVRRCTKDVYQEAKGYTPSKGQYRIVNFWIQKGIEGATKKGTAKTEKVSNTMVEIIKNISYSMIILNENREETKYLSKFVI